MAPSLTQKAPVNRDFFDIYYIKTLSQHRNWIFNILTQSL